MLLFTPIKNIRYITSNVPVAVKTTLKTTSVNVFQWFYSNGLKNNIDKCNFPSSLDITSKMSIENVSIQNSFSQNLLRATIDRHLSFNPPYVKRQV